ncbi:TPA: VWA domain-containing protein [Candidatus Woesearchaeota archaeon]|nr:VWA domain-containing protein [Candidatus Woesearchaeota archaeon]
MPLEFLVPLKEVLSRYLLDLGGLWALVALIPLIIIYLIRPRPKKKTVPALMFLMKERSKWDKSSFLRKIIKDPLLLLQIILMLLFAVTIAKPFMTVSQDIFVEKTAIVIDVSASSQVELDGDTRLTKAIDIAKENLGSKNAIITISSIPELVIDDADEGKAASVLNDLEPKDTSTNIFDGILFAGNYVKDKDRVIVISDFIETNSHKDFNAAKNILKSKGVFVDFIPIIDPDVKSKNVGIIDLDVNEDRTSVQIKNFNEEATTIHM